MRSLKIIANALLAFVLLSLCVTGCSGEGSTPTGTTAVPTTTDAPAETTAPPVSTALKLTEGGGTALFTIVRPEVELNDPIYPHADALAIALKEATGAEFTHGTDFIS